MSTETGARVRLHPSGAGSTHAEELVHRYGARDRSHDRVRAAYPGSFDPFTPGHLDVVNRARHLFDEVVVLVAINSLKQPGTGEEERAAAVRALLPVEWTSVTVAVWSGLTATYCRRHDVGVIVRGVRNSTDLQYEHQLAAMNQALGVPTVFLPAQPELAAMSSTAVRSLRK